MGVDVATLRERAVRAGRGESMTRNEIVELGRRVVRLERDALEAAVREEACPHDLAPTTSTTTALVLGDALAVALLQKKGFKREDFARLHPGGALGRQLVTRVEEIMLRDNLPVLSDGGAATM